MQLKHTVLALAAAGMLTTQAYASEMQVEAAQTYASAALVESLQAVQPLAAFSQTDINAMFEQTDKPMQLAVLSPQEMKETEGAVIWFAPVAWAGARFALTGFTRHGINQVISRNGVGVSNRAIMDALRNPLPGSRSFISGPNANTTRYLGQNATVNINRSGQVTSAWSRNASGWR